MGYKIKKKQLGILEDMDKSSNLNGYFLLNISRSSKGSRLYVIRNRSSTSATTLSSAKFASGLYAFATTSLSLLYCCDPDTMVDNNSVDGVAFAVAVALAVAVEKVVAVMGMMSFVEAMLNCSMEDTFAYVFNDVNVRSLRRLCSAALLCWPPCFAKH
uniref:Uncharacterized protein n=1 Tax=Glossina austeni TaxID=7395 RepID=A0A1A9UPM6_GLOAU